VPAINDDYSRFHPASAPDYIPLPQMRQLQLDSASGRCAPGLGTRGMFRANV
jgi:hypothetical protein